jgi:hypothetical protein
MSGEVDARVAVLVTALYRDARKEYSLSSDYDLRNVLFDVVLAEHADGRLHSRVRRFVDRNPAMLTMRSRLSAACDAELRRRIAAGFQEWLPPAAQVILDEIYDDLIAETLGAQYRIPAGIEENDMWLPPVAASRRLLQEVVGEDAAVIVVSAHSTADGRLQPEILWITRTENEELIAAVQAGHRRYMALLAAERGP